MVFMDETIITVVERSAAPDALSQLVECDWLRVLKVGSAFDGRERVTTAVTTMPQYVRACLARLYNSGSILWYT